MRRLLVGQGEVSPREWCLSRELAGRGVGQRLLYSSGWRVGFRGQQQAGDRQTSSGDAEKMGPQDLVMGGMWR